MPRKPSLYQAIPVEYVERDGERHLRRIEGLRSVEGTFMQLTMELDAGYDYLRECRAKRHLFLSTYAILQKGETLEDFESKRGVKRNEQKGTGKLS